MGFRRFLSLPVAVVLVLIGFVYHTVVFLVIEPWLSLSTAPGLFNALFFTGLGVMAVLCYVIAVLKDPGRIPSSYMPDLEDSGVTLHSKGR
ncbi:hypothetical protein Mapa_015075 [Marchantia paleacea]|nr:hypothetical protein Mapa_015075 [Marchantia paleacea]